MQQKTACNKFVMSFTTAVLFVTMLCLSCGTKPNDSQSSAFEYKLVYRTDLAQKILSQIKQEHQGDMSAMEVAQVGVVEDTLNDLGKEGWELIDRDAASYIFKRRLK